MDFRKQSIINAVMDNSYALDVQKFEYEWFKIENYTALSGITLMLDVQSDSAIVVLNEFLGTKRQLVRGKGVSLHFPIEDCENGDNALAYKGQILLRDIVFHQVHAVDESMAEATDDPLLRAAIFLLRAQIKHPKKSPFAGSCYAIFDYTNNIRRMSCWLWSDAPIVSAMLRLAQSNLYPQRNTDFIRLATDIGETMLRHQIANPKDEVCGAFTSRYRYYGNTERSFERLLGPNDTSYSIHWALLPLYEYTGDKRYLNAARNGLLWVQKIIHEMDFVPSHYYYEAKKWEDRAFVDTGFVVSGFEEYRRLTGSDEFDETILFCMERFIRQFRLPNGYYGQNYLPEYGADNRLFTRGHAWVLEGLNTCVRLFPEKFTEEAHSVAEKIAANQLADGSFNYLWGYEEPQEHVKSGTGICEKATAIFAYLLQDLEKSTMLPTNHLNTTAKKATDWCEKNMNSDVHSLGYGGIMAKSLSSGITGLPFLQVATGYANAYYIMAKLTQQMGEK